MRIGKINSTSFKGLYEIKAKKESKTTKNVPANDYEKDSVRLKFADVIYRPFMGEILDNKKLEEIKANVASGALEHGYTDSGDHYYLNAVVSEVYLGQTLNFTQDEWERVTGKNIKDEIVTKEALIGNLEDRGNYITEITPAIAEEIKLANNFKAVSEAV